MKTNQLIALLSIILYSPTILSQAFTGPERVTDYSIPSNSTVVNYHTYSFYSDSVIFSGNEADRYDKNGNDELMGCGAVYIFEKQNGAWTRTEKIVAADRYVGSNFGSSIDVENSTMIVGSYNLRDTLNGHGYGAAYIFEHNGSSWIQTQMLEDDSLYESAQFFGYHVGIEGDYMAVTCPGDAPLPYSNYEGSIHIFKKNGAGKWRLHQKIRGFSPYTFEYSNGSGDEFCMIDSFLVIGGDSRVTTPPNTRGSVTIFKINKNGYYSLLDTIESPEPQYGQRFGSSIEIYGNWMAVGAIGNYLDQNGNDSISYSGAVFMYELVNGSWTFRQKLVGNNRPLTGGFGHGVELDEYTLVVGAIYSRNIVGNDTLGGGRIEVFLRNSSGIWNYTQHISTLDTLESRIFGENLKYKDGILIARAGNYDGFFVYERGITGVNQHDSKASIKLYPNPTSDKILVESSWRSGYSYQIIGQLGEVITEGTSQGQRHEIELPANISSGMYYIRISNSGSSVVESFIFQKK